VSVLALDLGTSAVKAIIWNPADGVLARAHTSVPTHHPQPGHDEQDAADWWSAVQTAIAALPLDDVVGVGLSSARETFVCLDEDGRALRPAILWSDGRAPSPAARYAWLQEHEPDVVRRTRWLAAPKDYVLQQLVGRLVTDTTLASRTDVEGSLLPEIVQPRTVVGNFRGIPVVAGAGDRACEVLAVRARSESPMVSWGTTANCSLPLDGAVPSGWRASTHVDGHQLLEAGLSAAGAALTWLSDRINVEVAQLSKLAAEAPPGANGVIALPWLNGARAPWWRPDVDAQLIGVTSDSTPGDMARAVYEGVAHDVRRALSQLPVTMQMLRLAGGGADDPCWQQALSGITGVRLVVHGGDAAAIGAAELAVSRAGQPWVVHGAPVDPDPETVAAYTELAKAHDAAAEAVLGSLG
jgi:xylulokinase